MQYLKCFFSSLVSFFRNKIYKFLLIILAFSILTSCSHKEKDHEKSNLYLKMALGHMNNKKYPMALKTLLMSKSLTPENPAVYNYLGIIYLKQKQVKKSLFNFNKALNINPAYTEALINKANVFTEVNLPDKAIEMLLKAQQDLTYPHPDYIFYQLGLAYYKKKKYLSASDHFLSSLKLNSKNCGSSNEYAKSLHMLKLFKNAQIQFDNASKICPQHYSELQYFKGLNLFKLGQKKRARFHLKKVTELEPYSVYGKRASQILKKL